MNKQILIISSILIILVLWYKKPSQRINGIIPVPTEFNIKKSKRKDFKNERKEFLKNMHRSDSNINWEKLNNEHRMKRTKLVQAKRNSLVKNGEWKPNIKYTENIQEDLSGYWQERGSNNLAGRILTSDIDWTNNLIYCASDGGNIWRGSLYGENWISLTDYMQIKGIHFIKVLEFNNTKRILIANNDNFYFTDDEGFTIQSSNGLDFLSEWGGNSIKRAVITENNTIYLLVNEGTGNWNAVGTIYKSTDGGSNFTKFITLNTDIGISSNQSVDHFDIWTSRYFPSNVYILHNNEFFKVTELTELELISNISTNNIGENILTGGMGSNNPFFFAHIDGQIYQSINGGNSWINRDERPQWFFNLQNSFSSSNINRDYIFWGGMEVFKSSDGANTWNLVNNWWEYYGNEFSMLHADIPEIKFFLDPNYNEVALISTDGGLYYSNDYLETVQNLSLNGLGVSQYYSTYTKRSFPYNIYAGSQDQGFQRSINPQGNIYNFEQSISGDYGHLSSGDNGLTIWSNYPGFTMYYNNPITNVGGLTLDFPGSGHLWLSPLMQDPYEPNKAYLGGGGISGGNHLFHLTAGQSSISYIEKPYNFNSTISAMGYSTLERNNRYILDYNGNFYFSKDDGESWEQSQAFDGPNAHYFYGSTIWSSNTNIGKVIIGGSGYSNPPVYISYDHGETFENFSNGLPSTLVYEIVGTPDDQYLFAATEVGPYVYFENLNQWIDLAGISAPDQTYWSVEFISELNTVRFGTYGRGIWDFVIENSQTLFGDTNLDGIINVQDLILLVNFILEANIPNNTQFINSDINQDNLIDIIDIISIINIVLNP